MEIKIVAFKHNYDTFYFSIKRGMRLKLMIHILNYNKAHIDDCNLFGFHPNGLIETIPDIIADNIIQVEYGEPIDTRLKCKNKEG